MNGDTSDSYPLEDSANPDTSYDDPSTCSTSGCEEEEEEQQFLPSNEEQCKIIRDLEAKYSDFTVGEEAYLLPFSFFNKWRFNTGYQTGETTNSMTKGPIDTTSIYDADRKAAISDKYESHDFIIVTKPIWDQFKEWFGGTDAPIDVIKNPKNGSVVPIAQKVKTIVTYKEETKEIYVSKKELVGNYKRRALAAFGIQFQEGINAGQQAEESELEIQEEEKTEQTDADVTISIPNFDDFKLIDYWQHNFRNDIKDTSLIEDCNILENNDMFLDFRDGEKWYSDSLRTSSNQINYNYSNSNSYVDYSNYNSNSYFYSNGCSNSGYGTCYSYGQPLGPGKVGLQNLGNTCFFNSGIQCLMHSKPLVKELLSDSWEGDVNETNPLGMKGKLVRAFQSLTNDVWKGEYRVLSPSDLKRITGEFATQFAGWGQQDSHELINFMLDGIHEDLNRCREKPLIDNIMGDGTNDLEIAEQAWRNFKKRNDSIIVDHFYGQLRSRLKCPICNKTTVVFDPFMTLSLPISKPSIKELKVRFIPADFSSPYKGLRIKVPAEPKPEDYSHAISKALGKDVTVAMATFTVWQSTLKWTVEELDTYQKGFYLAFEIPEETKIYVPCAVKMMVNSEYYQNYASKTTVGSRFLLPIPRSAAISEEDYLKMEEQEKEEATKNAISELEKSAMTHLSCFWNPTDSPPETNDVEKIMRFVTQNETTFVPEGQRFGIDIESIGYVGYNVVYPLIINSKNPLVTKNGAEVYINDEERKQENGFSYASLMRHIPELEQNDDSDEDTSVTLEQCFQYFIEDETLDEDNQWFCPHCRDFVCANKKMKIWKSPQCLVLHLKRFSAGQYSPHKDGRFVDFPDEIDIAKFIKGPKDLSTKYRLYAVDEHMGGMGGGHYTAHAIVSPIDSEKGEWYSFNDSTCSEASSSEAHSDSAYVLFYQRIDEECPILADHETNASCLSEDDSSDATPNSTQNDSTDSSEQDDNDANLLP